MSVGRLPGNTIGKVHAHRVRPQSRLRLRRDCNTRANYRSSQSCRESNHLSDDAFYHMHTTPDRMPAVGRPLASEPLFAS